MVNHILNQSVASNDSIVEPPEWWPTSGSPGPTGWEYSDATRQINLI